MRKFRDLGLIIGFSIALSCSGGGGGNGIVNPPPPPPPPAPITCPANTVCMRAATFSPTELSVARGGTVTFENTSGITHDVIFDAPVPPGVSDIGVISSGSQTRTFTTAGNWNFHCTLHGGMNGRIVVS